MRVTDHSESYTDSEGEERCSTCDKWIERDYYTIEHHHKVEAVRKAMS